MSSSQQPWKSSLSRELKFGLFVNSASPTVVEELTHTGLDWVLIDAQHGPMNSKKLTTMLAAAQSGGAKALVRIAHPKDRAGIQQALDLGADGVLIPYVNTAEETRMAVSVCRYPTSGTRSVYFPQRSMNKEGLLGYAGNIGKELIIAVQIETADSIKNIDSIAQVDGVDLLFLGQNDLCMSMGLYEKYEYPHMYTSKELGTATDMLISAAKKNNKHLGIFLFGTDRVGEFIKKGFTFISVGNDLHFIMTQAATHRKVLDGLKGTKADVKSSSSASGGSSSNKTSSSESSGFYTLVLVAVIAGAIVMLNRN